MKLSEIKISLEDLAKFCAESDKQSGNTEGYELFDALFFDLFEHKLPERDKQIFKQ
jgi:hypothetical protein